MKTKWYFLAGAVLFAGNLMAQELYVATEPASNMPRHSIGIRLMNEGMLNPTFRTRNNLEVMAGLNKNLMAHVNVYTSDFYQNKQRFEGFSVYGKYRFLSIDSVQKHTRAAFFARFSSIKNPLLNDEINLEGDNSGLQGGVILTQLLHKLALSSSISYAGVFDNRAYKLSPASATKSIGYTLSAGYLVFPKVYRDYKQTNVNLYTELLGKTNPGKGQNIMDLAPALQFIFGSKFRVDLSQRIQLWGNMKRNTKSMYLLRLEYNFFNAF